MGRRLGQHFLARKSILNKIAEAACGERVPAVIEIGPGKGALTESLLERADRVIAIEIDQVLVHYLRQHFRDAVDAGRLELIEGDVLRTDLAQWGAAAIAGNLPYYITSPILERVFTAAGKWSSAVFLVQTEVAHRIAAAPGGRERGYLSVASQLYSTPEVLFEVSRMAFHPPPKVDSAVVKLTPREPVVRDPADFLRFASACFRHKRKTLRNNLAETYGREKADAAAPGRERAEALSIDQLVRVYEAIS